MQGQGRKNIKDFRYKKNLHKPQELRQLREQVKTLKKVLPENNSSRRASGYGNSPKTCVNLYQILENNARKRSKLLKKFKLPLK